MSNHKEDLASKGWDLYFDESYEEAGEYFRKSLKIDSSYIDALNGLAQTYRDQGHLPDGGQGHPNRRLKPRLPSPASPYWAPIEMPLPVLHPVSWEYPSQKISTLREMAEWIARQDRNRCVRQESPEGMGE